MAKYFFDIIEVEYPPGPYVLLDVNVSDGRQLMTEKEIDQHIDMCIRELNALRKKAKQSLKKLIKSKREISNLPD